MCAPRNTIDGGNSGIDPSFWPIDGGNDLVVRSADHIVLENYLINAPFDQINLTGGQIDLTRGLVDLTIG